MTLAEAAVFLKTTPETVSAMIRNEGLPAAKVGRAWVLVDEHIADWVSRRAKRRTSRYAEPPRADATDSIIKSYVVPARVWMRRRTAIDRAPEWCGVYFLFQQDTLSYVGSSANVRNRIGDHRCKGRAFDRFAAVKARPDILTALEAIYISVLSPPGNRRSATIPAWARPALQTLLGDPYENWPAMRGAQR